MSRPPTAALCPDAAPPSAPAGGRPRAAGRAGTAITARSLLLAIALTAVCGLWIRQAEVMAWATNITESVPAIPAVTVLLVLAALDPLVRALGRRLELTRAEILTVYLFVSISVAVQGVGSLRYLLSVVTVPYYLATPANGLASLQSAMPWWLVPSSPAAARDLYLRSPSGEVPWAAWAVPICVWTAFFVALWLCMWCLMLLVRRRWIDDERLTFPIVGLPLEITEADPRRGQPPFLRNRAMWIGFSISGLYNVLNILHALAPSVPAPGKSYDLAAAFAPTTAQALGPIEAWYRPELIGFGFLVPSEILFSAWFFWLAQRLVAMYGVMYARDVPGMPFEQEQGMGAYLLLGAWLLWRVRRDIVGSLRRGPTACAPGAPSRWAEWGVLATATFLCWFCVAAGMRLWVAVAYLLIVLVTAVVVARIRAEAGMPLMWLFPVFQQKKILFSAFGTAALGSGTVPAALTAFAMMSLLARGYFPSLIGYQIESLKVADEAGLSRRRLGAVLVAAVVAGLAVGFYVHLVPYYRFGAQNVGNGMIWGQWTAFSEYREVVTTSAAPVRPDTYRTTAAAVGAGTTAILLFLRSQLVGFPFSAIGYAVASCCGGVIWFPLLIVWAVKGVILRFGGMASYRSAIPFFLGLALGHFVVAGALWGALGALWPEAAGGYSVWFG